MLKPEEVREKLTGIGLTINPNKVPRKKKLEYSDFNTIVQEVADFGESNKCLVTPETAYRLQLAGYKGLPGNKWAKRRI